VKLALVVAALLLLVIALLIIVGLVWRRRSAHGSHRGRSRADAAVFLRAHGDDPRLLRRLRRLAADPRTPGAARGLLFALARYLSNPIVLAPDFVPILGQVDEVTIGSVLLWLSWRSLPLDVWEGAFPPATAPAARVGTGGRLGQALRRHEQAGQHDRLLQAGQHDRLLQAGQHDRLLQALDQTLPEWPVASTLIQVARELLELEHSVTLARAAGAPEAVTSRLTQEAQAVAEPLWRLADRIAAAAAQRVDSPRLQEELAREDQKLARLLPAIREARTGLAELTLADFGSADFGGRDAFRRAEGRFQALAATARELQDLGRGETA